MSVNKETVSIIIPVFNLEKYISRCIESVLGQTFQDWKLIVVDDGSDDNTGVICDAYQRKDNRITVLHLENCGVSSARNVGKRHASGEYVYFMDGDDWLAPDAIQVLVELAEKYEADVSAFDVYNVDEVGDGVNHIVKACKWTNAGVRELTGAEIYYEFFLWSATLWNKLFRRELTISVDFDREMTFGEDTVFLCKVMKNVRKAVVTDYAGYYYLRNRAGNVVSEAINSKALELLQNNRIAFDMLKECPDRTVPVHRLSVVINQVLNKIPVSDYRNSVYQEYISSCRLSARVPGLGRTIQFLCDRRYRLKWRLRHISFYVNPVIYLAHRAGRRADSLDD